MFWRVVALALIVGSFRSFATSIVAVRTLEDVSIAADSLGMFTRQDGSSYSRSVCKIHRIGDVFVGIAGFDADPINGFSVLQIVSDAIRGKRNFVERMAAAGSAIESALPSEARSLRERRPADFREITDPKAGGVAIILVGMEDGTPSVMVQKFGISVTPAAEIRIVPSEILSCPGSDCPGGHYIFRLGQSDAISKYLSKGPYVVADSAEFARSLVQLEVDDPTVSTTVGGPIDVVRISKSDEQWVQQKPVCR